MFTADVTIYAENLKELKKQMKQNKNKNKPLKLRDYSKFARHKANIQKSIASCSPAMNE